MRWLAWPLDRIRSRLSWFKGVQPWLCIALITLEDRCVVYSAGTGGWHVGNLADRQMRAAA